MPDLQANGHEWTRQEVDLDGEVVFHRQCQNCSRDFVRRKGSDQWISVYVGIFDFKALEDHINLRWLAEPCPGKRLPEERNEARKTRSNNGAGS